MKKPTTMSTKYQEEIYDHSYPVDPTLTNGPSSPYLHDNSVDSDNESMSDSSRKIRKKRNTYQKISDDIRVQLLDAVQNGETLKSAAKRHKINYSSAKSILHTYRKEGRILKKSAQERTTKKRVSSTDMERPSKVSKLSRKENLQPDDDDCSSPYTLPNEKSKHDAHADEHHGAEGNNHVMGLLNSNYDDHHDTQAPTEAAAPSGHHAYPKSDGPLTVRKHENISESHANEHHKGSHKGDHHYTSYRARTHDHSHAAHHDSHDSSDHHPNSHNHHNSHHHHHHHQSHHSHYPSHYPNGHHRDEHGNYHFSRELDSFNDAVHMWQARSANHTEPNAYMPYGRYNLPTHLETAATTSHKNDHAYEHDDHADTSVSYLLKSFMDIQGSQYHQPIRKSSFVSYNGNGFRKESFDFI